MPSKPLSLPGNTFSANICMATIVYLILGECVRRNIQSRDRVGPSLEIPAHKSHHCCSAFRKNQHAFIEDIYRPAWTGIFHRYCHMKQSTRRCAVKLIVRLNAKAFVAAPHSSRWTRFVGDVALPQKVAIYLSFELRRNAIDILSRSILGQEILSIVRSFSAPTKWCEASAAFTKFPVIFSLICNRYISDSFHRSNVPDKRFVKVSLR